LSVILPYKFFDPVQIPQNLFWMGAGWGIHYGLKKLLKHNPIKFNKKQIWRNFQWFRIVCHGLAFLGWVYASMFCEVMRFKSTEKRIEKIMFYNFKSGFKIFKKLEPEMAEYIYEKLKELANKD